MALQLADRVLQTGTANTTVSFTLTGTVIGYQAFTAITTGNTLYYAASDGTNWEVGLGTLTSSTLLTRTTIYSSSNSGSAVTFSGTVTVWCDYPASIASQPAGATVTPTTTNATYYVVGSSATSGAQTIASVSVTNAVSYNASTGALTAVSMVSSSDERLKSNIQTLTNATQTVEKLRGVSYLRNDRPEIGVVAQEVEKVLPMLVHEDPEGYKSVAYGNMVGLLIEAVKELSAEVKVLKAELNK
jgi:hypothetical protein